MTDARKRLHRMLLFLFGLVVILPAYLSCGRGLTVHLGDITISHHVAAPAIGLFGVLLCLIYAFSPRLRAAALTDLQEYDAWPARRTVRVELWVWGGLGLWLAFLKAQESYFLGIHGFDTGVVTNILWNVAHGNGYWNSFLLSNYLGDHFAPFLYLLSLPYHWSVSPLWVLLAQTFAMMLGLWFAVSIAREIHPIRPSERILLIVFVVLNMYFEKIHAYDIHPIAFSMPVVLALYMLAGRRRWTGVYVLLPFALFTIQEDVSLMVAGLALVLWFSGQRKHGTVLLAASVIAFYLDVGVFARHMAGHASIFMTRYQSMGGSLIAISAAFLIKPWVPVSLLLRPTHVGHLLKVLLSFGMLPILAWPQALGLLPPILQHGLSDNRGQYTYGFHYSSNLLPFLIIATIASLSRRKWPYPRLLPGFLILAAFSCFQGAQYVRWTDPAYRASARRLAASIDPSVPVCAQDTLSVPFTFRRNIYDFPDIRDARVIIVAPAENSWPLTHDELNAEIAKLNANALWRKEQAEGGILVFRKID